MSLEEHEPEIVVGGRITGVGGEREVVQRDCVLSRDAPAVEVHQSKVDLRRCEVLARGPLEPGQSLVEADPSVAKERSNPHLVLLESMAG
ncbi:MAG: hypothetical protein ROO76_14865 [Terriglobia bacterium]|nr:hypothetical protein [Terriglobia bacterium]